MKVIVLDRDGVINQDSDDYIKSPEEWIPLPGSIEAIARLYSHGYRIIVATNQSGIARGLLDIQALHAMHAKMDKLLAEHGAKIDAVFFCPHRDEDACQCRKPKPGLLQDIAQRLNVSYCELIVVGDALRDIQAAQAVGAQPVLVRTGKGQRTIDADIDLTGVPIYDDLADFATQLLCQP